jgi:hypothetical protein
MTPSSAVLVLAVGLAYIGWTVVVIVFLVVVLVAICGVEYSDVSPNGRQRRLRVRRVRDRR